jgi:hypothetical protein
MSKPKRHGLPWTTVEEARLRQEAKNKPVTTIKKVHQRTEAAIRSKAEDLNISLKPKD